MGHWTKFFVDGTKYTGEDTAIQRKEASWRQSRNDGIVKVVLEHGGMRLEIEGPGEYWQSDSYECDIGTGISLLTRRRIEKKIQSEDHIISLSNKNRYHFVARCEPILFEERTINLQSNQLCGQWIVLEMNIKYKQVASYFSKDKI